jgi:hypothetical protein
MEKIIINKGEKFSYIDKRIVSTSEALKYVCQLLKMDQLKLVMETEFTIMYHKK